MAVAPETGKSLSAQRAATIEKASKLYIGASPAAFAAFAVKHNNFVDLLRKTEAKDGISWIFTEEKILISIDRAVLSELVDTFTQSLESRVAALETLTSGLSQQTYTVCSGGASSSKTFLSS